ncbi:origin recognition complex, subunit 4 [Hortaea werneckii]|nr:origin recognition complex, subunit 4 [Hortaea werneckii]KAI7321738.1 origin recognition complex, subunit 4 [Hortaea werneckii]
MDPERASKRRRLDTPDTTTERSTPDTQKNTSSTAPRGGRAVSRIEHLGNDDNSVTPAQSAQDAWREAKAKQRAFKQIKGRVVNERDVYDDIDGAHPSPPRKPATTVKKKPSVDPLRNQRNDPASSPLKKAPGGGGSFGFFKQFQKPKVETKNQKSKRGSHQGESRQDTRGSPEISESSEDSSADELARDTPASAPAGKGWVTENGAELHSGGRKKTFEDEIKELEEAAKKKADDEGPETLTAHPRRRQSGVQSVKENKRSAKQPDVSVSSQPRPKSSGKRATSQVKQHSDSNENTDAAKHVDTETPTRLPSTPSKGKPQPTPKIQQKQPPTAIFEPDELSNIQHALLERLTNKKPVPLTNLEDEYAKVSQVITQTVTAGESNSMLLIGARGSGKTALVNQILREQAAEHTEDFHVVRLNGFVHTDDKIALRDTWRQLGREMELDESEQGTAGKNYADTLASLLALLSHPAEQGREEAQDQVTKSVIFILDEFDLFASHPRQTLLYNLFDIAQSRKAPIAVLGLTTRVDVSESLEKRVKSRFSHRYVHLSLAKSFPAFVATCKAVVTFPEDDSSIATTEGLKKWKDTVEALFSEDGMQTHLRRIYYTTKSVSDFMASLLVPTAATFPADAPTSSTTLLEHFLHAIRSPTLRAPDSKLDILAVLSTLQLALLICAARLSAIYATDIVSFNLAYEEYKVLGSKARLQASASGALSAGASARVSGKEIARDAWAELVSMGLVMMEPGGRGGRVDVGLEEIGMSGVDLGTWGRWCKEI